METIANRIPRLLAGLLSSRGVKHVVVSPGTRSAPLAVAFARCGLFDVRVVIDERSAAFIALGMALRSDSPVAMICTSGSAMLNYGPALAEAYHRRVPLIALTADRPAEWIDQRDSQTICQPGALPTVVRHCADIPEDDGSTKALSLSERLISDALDAALGAVPGPVQINVQFAAPLTEIADVEPYIHIDSAKIFHPAASAGNFRGFFDDWKMDSRIMVVAGGMHPDKRLVEALQAVTPRVAVLAEAQANLHGFPQAGLADRNLSDMAEPDIVISIGGALVSASLKAWLRSLKNVRHISVGFDDCRVDTFRHLSAVVQAEEAPFFEALAEWLSEHPSDSTIDVPQIKPQPTVESGIMEKFASLCADTDVHLSNGTTVRHAQAVHWPESCRIDANRGVSGIDGSTSTAMGASMVTDHTTLLITGDMSAAYDIGALATAGLRPNFKMAVMNNGGGEIFRRITATRHLPELEDYFAVAPRLPLEKLADAYGFQYFEDTDAIEAFMAFTDKPAILNLKI